MKHSFKKALLLAVIAGLAACNPTAEPSIDKEEVTRVIAARFESFVTSMNRLSTEELKEFYSDDPRFYWTEDGRLQYADKETLVASLTGLVQSLKSTNLKVLRTQIDLLHGESAMLFAEYEQDVVMQSGFEFEINGAMTVLLQKEEGVWRFLIGHSSTKKQRGN